MKTVKLRADPEAGRPDQSLPMRRTLAIRRASSSEHGYSVKSMDHESPPDPHHVVGNPDPGGQLWTCDAWRCRNVPEGDGSDQTGTAESGDDDSGEKGDQQAGKGGTAGKSTEKPPTRFFATTPLDPDRAGFEVARIMDAFLVELTRSPDFSVRVMLDLAGHAGEEGYPKGVVEIVKANVRDLKIDQQPIDFGRWG